MVNVGTRTGYRPCFLNCILPSVFGESIGRMGFRLILYRYHNHLGVGFGQYLAEVGGRYRTTRRQGCKIDNGRRSEVGFVENQNHHDLSTDSYLKHIFLLMISHIFGITSVVDAESQVKHRVLVLGVRADVPPFSSFDNGMERPDKARGYTVDLCRRIAERAVLNGLYCSVEYKEVKAAERFKVLASGEINVLCGATTVTLERMRIADFSL